MAKHLMAIPMALAVALATQTVSLAAETQNPTQGGGAGTASETRAEAAIHAPSGAMIADVPGGFWATNATQWAVANNIMTLENGKFNGNEDLTSADLRHAMESLVNIAENIEGRGAIPGLRAAIGPIPDTDQPVNRLATAQVLARFLDAANNRNLLAVGALTPQASNFTDLGATIPPAVNTVVDRFGVMTGFRDGTFKPQGDVTRYQMAAISKNILERMRQAPIAQRPAAPVAVQPQPPTVVVVPPAQPAPVAVTPVEPMGRPSFREGMPLALEWQALNASNLQGPGQQFRMIPITGMLTGHQGPVMLQAVGNFRYSLLQNNFLSTEFRLGYDELKLGMLQLVPYVGGTVGLGANNPGSVEYTTYAGANYGGILSLMPMDNLEIWGDFGQNYLMGGGRWNSNFQPMSSLNAMGTVLSNYGLHADFYVSPNIALTLGVSTWQLPNNLFTATNFNSGVDNIWGGNVGLGFSF